MVRLDNRRPLEASGELDPDAPVFVPCDRCGRKMRYCKADGDKSPARYACKCGRVVKAEVVLKALSENDQRYIIFKERGGLL